MLTKLFKRNLKKNQETEQFEPPKQVKKQTLTEKLGLPFDLNEIECISMTYQVGGSHMFYIAISNGSKTELLHETCTNSQDEITAKLEEIKAHFRPFGNYINLGEGRPLINLNRINGTSLIWDKRDANGNKRNHVEITLSNGQTLNTNSEIYTSNRLSKNEFIHYTFWSNRNEHLYGK